MGLRIDRVNELIKREISLYLRNRYRSESTCWTITDVSVSADLRNGTVAYSVLGGPGREKEAAEFFRKKAGEIRKVVGSNVVTKYVPKFRFVRDEGQERGNRVLQILDELRGDEPAHAPDGLEEHASVSDELESGSH